jgi:hydrogenase-4 component B
VIPVVSGLALLVVGGMSALLLRRRAIAAAAYRFLMIAGGAVAAWPAVRVLAGGPLLEWRLGAPVPGGEWILGLDALSSVFLIAILLVGVAAAVFGTAYLAPEADHRPVGAAHLFFAIEIASLALVVTARSAIPFLVAWEIMAILAYLLVVFEHDRAEVRRAGLIYLIATHTGTLALIALFAYWGNRAGGLTFDALAAGAAAMPGSGAVVFTLALLGFGFKAGLVPFHFWLPGAHSAAPSHMSALMSGVVIKMGIYGLLRTVGLAGAPPAWWGWLVLSLGVLSGVLGVLWALSQHDLKRLLAYHSVENIGIILIGLGVGALGARFGAPLVAALGFAGAILHTVNHALFKSLLFLAAGAIQRATGTRVIDQLGGLARRMPLTWAAFLTGSVAIVGLPPLNGFVSEWLVYNGLLRSGEVAPARAALFAVAGLALVGALALACFAKVGGAMFLGQARSSAAAGAADPGGAMLTPIAVLVAACLVIGIGPALVVGPVIRAGAWVSGLGQASGAEAAVSPGLARITVLAVALLLLPGAGWWFQARRLRGRAATAATWGCGYDSPTPRMQYTASSFAAPLSSAFGTAAGVRVVRAPDRLTVHPSEIVLERLALPLWARVRAAAIRLRPIQHGRLWAYVLYLLGTLLVLLLYLALAARGSGP